MTLCLARASRPPRSRDSWSPVADHAALDALLGRGPPEHVQQVGEEAEEAQGRADGRVGVLQAHDLVHVVAWSFPWGHLMIPSSMRILAI